MEIENFTYKISLFEPENTTCQGMALMAARSNGNGTASTPIENIVRFFENQQKNNLKIDIGNNALLVKIKDRSFWKYALLIEKCEEFLGRRETKN